MHCTDKCIFVYPPIPRVFEIASGQRAADGVIWTQRFRARKAPMSTAAAHARSRSRRNEKRFRPVAVGAAIPSRLGTGSAPTRGREEPGRWQPGPCLCQVINSLRFVSRCQACSPRLSSSSLIVLVVGVPPERLSPLNPNLCPKGRMGRM